MSEFKYLFSLDSYDNDCEKMFERENGGEQRLPGSLKNYEIKIIIKTHKTKNIYYDD